MVKFEDQDEGTVKEVFRVQVTLGRTDLPPVRQERVLTSGENDASGKREGREAKDRFIQL